MNATFARIFVALMGLSLLGACNLVVTPAPVFTSADEAGAPVLRPGIWRGATNPNCSFDESAPLAKWPECANGFALKAGEIGGYDTGKGATAWSTMAVVAARGDPRVLQVHVVEPVPVAGSEAASSNFYLAFEPTRTDPQGRITNVDMWFVECGPPDSKTVPGLTAHPLAGLTMTKEGNDCTTTSKAALTAAAKASKAWREEAIAPRWVRDGEGP